MSSAHVLVSWRRIALTGALAAVLVAATGALAERLRFGATDEATTSRLARRVDGTLASRARGLRDSVTRLVAAAEMAPALSQGPTAARQLFELIDRLGESARDDESISIYAADDQMLAWAGRPSTLPAERLTGQSALFVAPGPLGLRLVYVAPVMRDGGRVGSVAAECVLSPGGVTIHESTDFRYDTSPVPVTLVPSYALSGGDADGERTVLRGMRGEPLLDIRVDATVVAEARARWRRNVLAAVGCVLVATLLLLGAPAARWRLRGRWSRFIAGTATLVTLLLAARVLLWWSLPWAWVGSAALRPEVRDTVLGALLLRSPVDMLANGFLALALVGIGATVIERVRLAHRTQGFPVSGRERVVFVLQHLAAGTCALLALAAFAWMLRETVEYAAVDVLHLSFHPYDYPRLALLFGLVLLHSAAVWACILALVAGAALWRVTRGNVPWRVVRLLCWIAPSVVVVLATTTGPGGVTAVPLFLTMLVAAGVAFVWRRLAPAFRRGSQTLRAALAVAALVLPSLLMYPPLAQVADRAKRTLIEDRFATETLALPRTLLSRLDEALREIDHVPVLADLASSPGRTSVAQTETAFAVWRRTALAAWRLTSAVEFYDGNGRLVSRFALSLPEYEPRSQRYQTSSCRWDVFGEAAPFGSEDRRMLHAERGLCRNGRVTGAIVVHVLLDYATLPFISSQNPYFEIFRGQPGPASEDVPGSDIGLVIYGWGRTAVFTTAARAWALTDALFQQLYRSNQGFWTTLEASDGVSEVYFVSDRNGIYALGYPSATWFDHSVHLAELAALGALAACVVLLGASVLQRLAFQDPWTGRQLLREIRTSFSRKLFLAFVAATVIPVLILAGAIRVYVALRLRHDIEAEAARTAEVAQRVIEETLSIERRAEIVPSALDDDALVWISRIINQDVNVYIGSELLATSERDLFASGQLPTRTPDGPYRAIGIDRLPTYVGEDEIAGFHYLMAATPVRTGDRDAVLTVPFTLRQREIEREIDELDRGVQLGALVFILLGAGIGYWLAERISDPVQRLTRASRRIAAGDLDTRVFVRSADELRRLVEAFNRMAWELQRQRVQLERTNRLEAWADMARQVAHDIKNPLTPIQLSAEHLRRVHADRGQPLSPVLESCVETILSQVRLLRQIAGDFSSFATTPVPRPVATDVRALLEEIVNPYVTGLSGRVAIVLDLAPDLPPIEVDRTLVGRAVSNIIENALHAMAAGGTLTVKGRPDRDAVLVSISDTGVGMEEDALQRMFEPYFSTKATGTGLGLTIAKRNIELNGGTITIASQKGVGTTVSFTLPYAARAETSLLAAAPAPKP